jgi:hypothetical protein
MDIPRITNLTNVAAPDMRNGVAAQLVAPARRESIPAKYFWGRVGGLTSNLALSTVYSAVAFAGLLGAEPGATARNAGTLENYAGFGLADARLAVLRTHAIILGGVRAGVATAYRIRAADIAATEATANDIITVNEQAGTYALPSGHVADGDNLTFVEAALVRFLTTEMTADEISLFFMCTRLGMAIPPLVGCSLLDTGHHYLTSVNKPFLTVERQVVRNTGGAAQAAWDADIEVSRDLAYHKSCHPIADAALVSLARSKDLRDRLVAAGLGSAAVRLPYVEQPLRAARAYLAVVSAVAAFGALSGMVASTPGLSRVVAYIDTIPATIGANNAMPAPPQGLQQVATRDEAITRLLEPAILRAQPAVATASGILIGLVEDAGGNPNTESRLNAYSIRKLRADFLSSVAMGTNGVRQFKLYQRKQIEDGEIPTFNISDA